jgi:hypothetical protein
MPAASHLPKAGGCGTKGNVYAASGALEAEIGDLPARGEVWGGAATIDLLGNRWKARGNLSVNRLTRFFGGIRMIIEQVIVARKDY